MKLVVVGVGFPDIIRIIESINRNKKEIDFLGFVDDKREVQGKSFWNYPVLGRLDWLKENKENCKVINTVALTTQRRKKAHQRIKKLGANFTSLVHPDVDISHSTIGEGTIICQGAIIGPNAIIDSHVIISWNTSIGHDSKIGKFSFIAAGASVLGHVKIGKGVMIGANSACYPKISVGDWGTVGMCSAVINNVPNGATFMGSPAKRIF